MLRLTHQMLAESSQIVNFLPWTLLTATEGFFICSDRPLHDARPDASLPVLRGSSARLDRPSRSALPADTISVVLRGTATLAVFSLVFAAAAIRLLHGFGKQIEEGRAQHHAARRQRTGARLGPAKAKPRGRP